MTQAKLDNDEIDESFISTLRDKPDLFQSHPELLELVNLSDSRGTASLLEKQVEILKERLREFHNRQQELINVARENEHISDTFSPILSQLIAYKNLSEFATEFPTALKNSFDIDEVSIKTQAAANKRPSENKGYEDAVRRLINQQAVCDNRWPKSIMALFFSEQIASAALIPLKKEAASKEIIGVIALGSKRSDKYTNELGTAHLDRLGLMAGICVNRLQPSSI